METKPSFGSILDLKESPYKERPRPAFYGDLNLDQIIERIRRDWGGNISSFFYYLPADRECEDYRREVFADVKSGEVYEDLYVFYKNMKARRDIFTQKGEVSLNLQRAVWHIREVWCYCDAFSELYHRLEDAPLRSAGMLGFRDYLKQYLEGGDFQSMYGEAEQLWEQLKAIRLVLTYENDRIAVAAGEMEGAYDTFLEQLFSVEEKMKSPFESLKELTELEQEVVKICQKLYPEFFRRVREFYKKHEIYASEVLTDFASEIEYYLSYYRFEKRMTERGFVFAEPMVVSSDAEAGMSAKGLYDLALACAACEEKRDIVSNDMVMGDGERFYVLTGPNQGGKTTFARSLGQLVFFTKMGLDVPAAAARVYCFTEILTHFSVEESVETGRGKLKEELERLLPMMTVADAKHTRAFVVINELFTTAANYDACIMGKRVLEHFLERDCRGIYVTHLKELSQAHPGIVSLRAMLDEQGRHTFRIARGDAADSASAVHLVEKHGLTYDQLKERLAGKCFERNALV